MPDYKKNATDTYDRATELLKLDTSSLDTTAIMDLIPPPAPNSPYSQQQKAEAVAYYYALRSLRKVAKMTDVPVSTLSLWKNQAEWWGIVWRIFDAQKNEQLDAHLTDIIDRTIVEMKDRIENGDEKVFNTKEGLERIRVKVPFKDLAVAGIGVTYDKRALGRGQATSRVEHKSEGDRMKKLEEQFRNMSKQKVIEGEVLSNEKNQ